MDSQLSKVAVVSVHASAGKSIVARNLAYSMNWMYKTYAETSTFEALLYKEKNCVDKLLVECSRREFNELCDPKGCFKFVLIILDSKRCEGCDTSGMIRLVQTLQKNGIPHGALINNHESGMDRRITDLLESLNVPLLGRIPTIKDTTLIRGPRGAYLSDPRMTCILKAIGRILDAHIERVH